MPLIAPGKNARAFSLPDQRGVTHKLSQYQGHPVVLYFYPKDATPGCTQEACDFRDALPTFSKAGAAVLGISVLDSASKKRFADKHQLPFPLLADENHAVSEKYGVWQAKSLYGRTFMGIVRTTYLLDARGTVARRWDKVKVKGHVDEVLRALAELA